MGLEIGFYGGLDFLDPQNLIFNLRSRYGVEQGNARASIGKL